MKNVKTAFPPPAPIPPNNVVHFPYQKQRTCHGCMKGNDATLHLLISIVINTKGYCSVCTILTKTKDFVTA
jgi:hypothetical protein